MKGQKSEENGILAGLKRFFASKWHYLLVFIFGAILSAGVWAFATQIMTGDDYAFHVTRLESASRAWSNGQIVPQVDPDALEGFGYAYNIFYGPLLTYLAAGLQALMGVWPYAINLVLLICMIGSGLIMCYVMTKISGKRGLAVLVSVFYMAAPYTLNNLYSRMALGEVAATLAAPILLLGLWYLTTKQKHAARCIAISAAMLVLSHSLSAMLFALMAAIYVLLNFRKIFNFNNVWRMILGVAVALGLTAFFTLPLVEAKMKGDYGIFNSGYADIYFGANPRSMNDHRIWPQQLMLMNYAGGTNAEGLGGEFGVTLGIIFIIGLLGFWFVRRQIEDDDQRRLETSLYIIAILTILLALPVVNWYIMPGILWQMQFPWRALMVSTLALSVVSGYTVFALIKNLSEPRQRVAVVAISMAAIYLVMPLIMPRADRHIEESAVKKDPVILGWEAEYAPMAMLCSPDVEEDVKQGYACSLGRIREKIEERGTDLQIVSGKAKLDNIVRDGLRFDFDVSGVSAGGAKVELPVIYYPGYAAQLDGEDLEVGYSEASGLVEVTLPEGKTGKVMVRYGLSLATKVGLMISVSTAGLGVLWMMISAIVDRRRRKKEDKAEADAARMMDSIFEVVESEVAAHQAGLDPTDDGQMNDMSEQAPEHPIAMEDLMPPSLPLPTAMPVSAKPALREQGEADGYAGETRVPADEEAPAKSKATTKKQVTRTKKAEAKADLKKTSAQEAKKPKTAAKTTTKTRVVKMKPSENGSDGTKSTSSKTTTTRVKHMKLEEGEQ